MNLRFLLPTAFLLFIGSLLTAQNLVSSTFVGSRTAAQLIAEFNVPFVQFGAKYYKILYSTPDVHGVLDTASGLMAVPDDPTKIYPRLVYQHGTSGSRQDVPSVNVTQGGEGRIGLLCAGLGYVVFLPDYLGLGASRGFHPYVHAASEASAAMDMLRAGTQLLVQNQIFINDQLFITGYSQGGHAAMALHRAIEKDPSKEFTVTAAAPLSGPYSIGEAMRDLILTDKVYYYPAYIPNTALSYQTVYGNVFTKITDVFKPLYAVEIEKFYKNQISLSELNEKLITLLTVNEGSCRPFKMLQDTTVQAVITNPNHPINVALLANNTYNNWIPKAPMRLFYCMADDQVPFQNSIVARDTLTAAGAPNFQATDVNPTADHGGCVSPALFSTVLFFSGFIQIGTVGNSAPAETSRLGIAPNPVQDVLRLVDLPDAGRLEIIDFQGRVHINTNLSAGDHELDVANLPKGIYVAQFISGKRIWTARVVK